MKSQLQRIIDGSRHPIFVKDLKGRYIQTNAAFDERVRLPKDAIIGHASEDIFPPEVAAADQADDLQALIKPGGVENEVQMDLKDGRHTFTVHKFPLRDQSGHIYALFGFGYDVTDRKQAEAALQQSEEKFRQLAENISEVFWISDPAKRRIEYVNPAFEAIWGRTRESLLSSPQAWTDAIHPDDRMRVIKAVSNRHKTGKFAETYRIIRPDGSVRWIHDRAYPVRDARGEVGRLVGVAADITELRRIQEELTRQEEQYRGVFTAVTDGLIIRKLDETAVEVNPSFCKMLGYSRDEVLRLKPEDFLSAESLPLYKTYLEALRSGGQYRFEGQCRLKGGTLLPVEVAGTLLRYGGNDYFLAAVRDITPHKEAQAALRKSEADFRATFENAPIGIALIAPDGRVIRSNSAAHELLGYSESELQRMFFKEFTHPDDVQPALEAFQELVEGKRTGYQVERRYVRKGGGVVTVRLTISMVHGPEAKVQYAVAMLEDITEKKKMAKQFLRAQRMESIGTLASGIAHDLNNILAPILMAAGLLKGKMTDPRDKEIVTIVENGAQRGASIIRQLLTFGRGLEGAKVNVQIRHLVNDMVHVIRETFPRNIEISSKASADLWMVNAEATQLYQVLMNLCVNARDAMPNGGKLTVSAENIRLEKEHASLNALAKPGSYVVVTVSDTGGGIPKEIINRIFEPFFTTKDVSRGTGLGLSTVMDIVKHHGGFVTVYSEPGKGTQFKVYLPASDAPQIEAAEIATFAPLGNGELILVVDDEASIREATKQMLEANQYRVLTAANGAEALRVFLEDRKSVQLVLTDIMMPTMDGAHLIRSLRTDEPHLRLVAMSGLDEGFHTEELEALGVREFLTKPFDATELLNAVHRALIAPRV
jgi:PAS domain S-box-containing protein